jgi:hypothetical protein
MVEGETALQDALQTTLASWDDPEVDPFCITYGLLISASFSSARSLTLLFALIVACLGSPAHGVGYEKSVAQSGARPSTKAKDRPALTDQ